MTLSLGSKCFIATSELTLQGESLYPAFPTHPHASWAFSNYPQAETEKQHSKHTTTGENLYSILELEAEGKAKQRDAKVNHVDKVVPCPI